jgi:hypothetical protein
MECVFCEVRTYILKILWMTFRLQKDNGLTVYRFAMNRIPFILSVYCHQNPLTFNGCGANLRRWQVIITRFACCWNVTLIKICIKIATTGKCSVDSWTALHMKPAYTAKYWEYYRTKQYLILPLNLIQHLAKKINLGVKVYLYAFLNSPLNNS